MKRKLLGLTGAVLTALSLGTSAFAATSTVTSSVYKPPAVSPPARVCGAGIAVKVENVGTLPAPVQTWILQNQGKTGDTSFTYQGRTYLYVNEGTIPFSRNLSFGNAQVSGGVVTINVNETSSGVGGVLGTTQVTGPFQPRSAVGPSVVGYSRPGILVGSIAALPGVTKVAFAHHYSFFM